MLFLFFWHAYDSDVGAFEIKPEVPKALLIFLISCFFIPFQLDVYFFLLFQIFDFSPGFLPFTVGSLYIFLYFTLRSLHFFLHFANLWAKRGWKEAFKVMKGKDLYPRLLYLTKLSFRMEGQIKYFPNKVKLKQIKCFPNKVKLKEFIITKPLLYEMSKGLI